MHPTGVDRVGLEYIRHYGEQARSRAVLSESGYSLVLSEKQTQRAFEVLLRQDFADKNRARKIVVGAAHQLLYRDSFPGSTLLHTSHSGIERIRYWRGMNKRGLRSVVMVHDLIPLTHAEYCRPEVDKIHRKRIHAVLSNASGVITNSQFTLDSLKDEAQATNLQMPPAVVAHLASGIKPLEDGPRPIPTPYFVLLGTIEPRKNHWFLLHVWRRLVEQLGSAAPKLVVIGRRGWECENVVDMLERCAALKGVVIEEASCSDERLRSYLQHAQALLFPSFVEGYGMPLAEALALQVPVLASDIAVFHEIADDIPEYIDPLDGPGWLAHIKEYMQPESTARAAQLERTKRFREPTWARHFEQVNAFISTLAK
jgi:glycosyltransferase involved in cell wall biosynthesis